MAYIFLTKMKEAIVDDDLYDELSKFRWYASGYDFRPARRCPVRKKIILMYHQILGIEPGSLNGLVVDHIDRNPLNNMRANLRVVTQAENLANSITAIRGRGVGYDARHDRWKAYLPGSPRINLGTFLTEDQALAAVAQAKELRV